MATSEPALLIHLLQNDFIRESRVVDDLALAEREPVEIVLRRRFPVRIRVTGAPTLTRAYLAPGDGTLPDSGLSIGCRGTEALFLNDGSVRSNDLPAGRYVLVLEGRHSGDNLRVSHRYVPFVLPGPEVVVPWEPRPVGTLDIAGIPPGECYVRVTHQDGSMARRARGNGPMELPVGRVDVVARCIQPMLRATTRSFELIAGRTTPAKLSFEDSPTLNGRVVPRGGNVRVTSQRDDWTLGDESLSVETDANGRFVLGPLLNAAFTLTAVNLPEGLRSDPIEVSAGTAPVSISTRDWRWSIRAVDEAGAPLQDVRASGGRLIPKGNVLEYLPLRPPTHDVFLWAGEGRAAWVPAPRPGQDLGPVTLRKTWLAEGRILDADTGQPIAGATIWPLHEEIADLDAFSDTFRPGAPQAEVVHTGADGSFRFPHAADGTPVLVTHPGHGRRQLLLSRDSHQRLTLDRRPSIAVSVRSEEQLSCVAARNARSYSEGLRYVVVPRGETVSIDGLLEGRWTLHLGCDPDSRPVRTLDVRAGQRYPVTLGAPGPGK